MEGQCLWFVAVEGPTMPHAVDVPRLRRLLREGAAIGTDPARGPGLFRPALSPRDLAGRAWLRREMARRDAEDINRRRASRGLEMIGPESRRAAG